MRMEAVSDFSAVTVVSAALRFARDDTL